jgi:hypothetical protein
MRVLPRHPPVRCVASLCVLSATRRRTPGTAAKRGFFGLLAEWARAEKVAGANNDNASPKEEGRRCSRDVPWASYSRHARRRRGLDSEPA